MDQETVNIEHYDEAGNLIGTETITRPNPDRVLRRALIEIDAIANLADAKAFLRRLVIALSRALGD